MPPKTTARRATSTQTRPRVQRTKRRTQSPQSLGSRQSLQSAQARNRAMRAARRNIAKEASAIASELQSLVTKSQSIPNLPPSLQHSALPSSYSGNLGNSSGPSSAYVSAMSFQSNRNNLRNTATSNERIVEVVVEANALQNRMEKFIETTHDPSSNLRLNDIKTKMKELLQNAYNSFPRTASSARLARNLSGPIMRFQGRAIASTARHGGRALASTAGYAARAIASTTRLGAKAVTASLPLLLLYARNNPLKTIGIAGDIHYLAREQWTESAAEHKAIIARYQSQLAPFTAQEANQYARHVLSPNKRPPNQANANGSQTSSDFWKSLPNWAKHR